MMPIKHVRTGRTKGNNQNKRVTDKANSIPPPRMKKTPLPATTKSSYAPRMIRPTKKG